MVCTCNCNTWETEGEDYEFKDSLGYIEKPVSKKCGVCVYVFINNEARES